jgi:hypothetical protein
MGQPELFAQQTFADETEPTTGGAAEWQDPPEIRLGKVTTMSSIALCVVSVTFFDAAADSSAVQHIVAGLQTTEQEQEILPRRPRSQAPC